jgi:hypothetical protein
MFELKQENTVPLQKKVTSAKATSNSDGKPNKAKRSTAFMMMIKKESPLPQFLSANRFYDRAWQLKMLNPTNTTPQRSVTPQQEERENSWYTGYDVCGRPAGPAVALHCSACVC